MWSMEPETSRGRGIETIADSLELSGALSAHSLVVVEMRVGNAIGSFTPEYQSIAASYPAARFFSLDVNRFSPPKSHPEVTGVQAHVFKLYQGGAFRTEVQGPNDSQLRREISTLLPSNSPAPSGPGKQSGIEGYFNVIGAGRGGKGVATRGAARGRGASRGTSARGIATGSASGRKKKKTYIQLGREQLAELFPSISAEDIESVFKEAGRDMSKAIRVLSDRTNTPILDDTGSLWNHLTTFRLTENVGDLFSVSGKVSLCHCVSEDLAMGKGIAVLFKKKFKKVDELKAQMAPIGGVAYIKHRSRHVFYLITKAKYWDKPTYTDLRSSLEAMKELCMKLNITELAMPRIGCGLDGLVWNQVKAIVKDVFWLTHIQVRVYRLE
eukprot:TRINITY_DN3443_c0_g1_i1.p1 TRINITY_DN3443_c0_g1~~TRINITY_DN3443_c0_g1_i1.p1  ORF type:complete len:383 (+),score=57.91 TRINITY_DN3443_c0_g1_i1:86-1234(+)